MTPLYKKLGIAATAFALATMVANPSPAGATPLAISQYLDLAMTNRDAASAPGGVNSALPTDSAELEAILQQAKSANIASTRYAAVLDQYWLARSTEAAGISLAEWDPQQGVAANKNNLVSSYTYYEGLQLEHPELQWAGMAGMVGADFGGGMLDLDLATMVYEITQLQPVVAEVVRIAHQAAGEALVNQLPEGLRALATVGQTITPEDIKQFSNRVLVMQKNIFGDLMPLHTAYVNGGLAAVDEMVNADIYPDEIGAAFRDIASTDPARIAAGNTRLLQREQGEVIREQWDQARAFKGDVGEALTYATTFAGSPSVAGVVPPRELNPIVISTELNGTTVTLTTPLPGWNWASYPERWAYITEQLLPKYADLVNDRWPEAEAILTTPYEYQLQSHRVTSQIPHFIGSLVAATSVRFS